jgi:hypothetical protein
MTNKRTFRHCEERSDEAISTFSTAQRLPVLERDIQKKPLQPRKLFCNPLRPSGQGGVKMSGKKIPDLQDQNCAF